MGGSSSQPSSSQQRPNVTSTHSTTSYNNVSTSVPPTTTTPSSSTSYNNAPTSVPYTSRTAYTVPTSTPSIISNASSNTSYNTALTSVRHTSSTAYNNVPTPHPSITTTHTSHNNISSAPHSSTTPTVQPDEPILNCSQGSLICMSFLNGECPNLDCSHLHTNVKYLWAYWIEANQTWYKFANQKCLEKSFCNPLEYHCMVTINQNGCNSKLDITFNDNIHDSFSADNFEIRRFCTPSYGLKQDIMATQWLWNYSEQNCYFVEYSKNAGCSLSSLDFEKALLQSPEKDIIFTLNGNTFVTRFECFKQIDIDTQTSLKMRRRPKYSSSSDNPEQKKRSRHRKRNQVNKKQMSTNGKGPPKFLTPIKNYPKHWTSTGEDSENYLQPVPCSYSNREFRQVIKIMKQSMPNVYIRSLYRIENKKLHQQFALKRKLMVKELTEKELNEASLFHGCPETSVDPICHQGFDCRLSGERVGTRYGKGAYFALDASYSDYYCEQSSKRYKEMFMAKVLVGRLTLGSPEYRRPPPIGNSLQLYDTCVDAIDWPKIFVIFDSSQVYPEYLIEYR